MSKSGRIYLFFIKYRIKEKEKKRVAFLLKWIEGFFLSSLILREIKRYSLEN